MVDLILWAQPVRCIICTQSIQFDKRTRCHGLIMHQSPIMFTGSTMQQRVNISIKGDVVYAGKPENLAFI
ncbi:hypothetical protein AYJ10_23770 [Serratia marcescens]|nr:hypothetical protein AYJ10_23770 [Serratia marcescens]